MLIGLIFVFLYQTNCNEQTLLEIITFKTLSDKQVLLFDYKSLFHLVDRRKKTLKVNTTSKWSLVNIYMIYTSTLHMILGASI